jgi:glycosyltransferase involved in cell wall biosynthesis
MTRHSGSLRILLSTEGTYPFRQGGVSTWCDLLIRNLPDLRFAVASLVSSAGGKWLFPQPVNLDALWEVPLYGVDGLHELPAGSLADRWRRQRRTDETVIRRRFVPLLGRFLEVFLAEDGVNAADLEVLVDLHHYCLEHDLAASLSAPRVWREAGKLVADHLGQTSGEVVGEVPVSQALCLLARVIAVLGLPIPAADVVHTTATGLCSLPCLVQRLRDGTPYLLTEHGVYLRERYLDFARWERHLPFKTLALRFFRNLAQANYQTADMIVPVCEYNRRWEERLGAPADRIRVVYNGVDEHVFKPHADGLSGRDSKIAYVGRISPLKDIGSLLRAMSIVKRDLPQAQLNLWGSATVVDEPYLQNCLSLCRELKLDGSIRFRGRTEQPQLAYQDSSLVVLPSLSEGFPFCVIEAMMSGVPVIATAVGGVPEMLETCGTLVAPRDPAGLAGRIQDLLTDRQELQRVSDLGREIALQRFRLGTMTDTYREVYHKVAH